MKRHAAPMIVAVLLLLPVLYPICGTVKLEIPVTATAGWSQRWATKFE